MMRRTMVWRQRLGLWLPALLFFVVNLLAAVAYPLVYQGRQQTLERGIEQARAELNELQGLQSLREDQLRRAELNAERVRDFHVTYLSSQSERLTRTIAELRDLEQRVGLKPRAISYPEETIERHGLVKRSVVFGVEGTYMQLRRLINLLELTDTFLSLEEVSLTGRGSESSRLRINLAIATYFVDTDSEGAES